MLNVSNRPSAEWPEEQKESALEWCCDDIQDLPYYVDPILGADELTAMVEEIFWKIINSGHTVILIDSALSAVFINMKNIVKCNERRKAFNRAPLRLWQVNTIRDIGETTHVYDCGCVQLNILIGGGNDYSACNGDCCLANK